MNLRQLEIFHAIMMTGTTNAAAQRLGISQPAVSNMIRHIETSLGLELFKREKGRLEPTEDAQALFTEVKPLFSFYRAIDRKVNDIKEKRVGTLRIVSTSSPANTLIPLAIKRFLLHYPEVRISLDVQRLEDVIDQVHHNIADIGFTLTVFQRQSLASTPIHIGQLVCAIPKGHSLASREVIRPEDLNNYPFITMERETPLGAQVAESFKAARLPMCWTVETPFFSNACAMANAGVGCALVDEYTAGAGHFPDIVIRPFLPRIPVTLFSILGKNRPLSRLAQGFLDNLEAELASPDGGTS